MPVAELHFFHADDPNGSTIFECSTDDDWVKGVHLNIERDSLGGGTVTFARKVPAGGLFQREIIEPEVLVRVLLPAISETKYYHGFFINPRQQQVISKAEQGGEGFIFGGPGPKHYLERMLLWSASFAGYDNAVDRESGIWTWPASARAGAILARLFIEDQANPSGPFLPALTKSFSDTNDSDSVAWADDISAGDDDFNLRIQDSYLKIMWILEDLSGMVTDIDLGEVGAPLLQLNAYQTYGEDLTADILFEEGVNIAADLDVEGSSYAKASHALVKGSDGAYELAVRPGWSAGDLRKVVPTAWDTSNNVQLDNAGERYLSRQQNGEKQIKLHIIPGTTALAGEYFPGPPGTGSDFWTGDTVSLTTGMGSPTELDYDDEPQAVTGIELELTKAVRDDTTLMAARSWDVQLHLNEERKSSNGSRDLAGNRGTVQAATPFKLCQAGSFDDTDFLFLGSLGAACSSSGSNPNSDYPPWAGDTEERVQITISSDVPVGHGLVAVIGCQQANWGVEPDIVYDEQGNTWTKDAEYENTGSSSDDTVQIWHCNVTNALDAGDYIRWAVNLSGSLDPASETGGRCIGVAEYNSTLTFDAAGTGVGGFFPTGGISITSPAGQLVVAGLCGAVTFTNGDNDWDALIPFEDVGGSGALHSSVYAQFLLDAASTTWQPVAAGDLAAIAVSYDVAAVDGTNSPRDGNADLVGTSKRVARCDHRHDVHRDAEPTVDDDWATAGYKVGTTWAVVDDLGSPTEILSEWILLDDTTGAAVWWERTSGGSGSVPTPMWLDAAGGNALVNAQTHSANNRGIIRPVMIMAPCTITKIRINLAVSNGTLSCAVYDSAFARLGTSGSVASPGTGWQDITLSSPVVITTPGHYWFGFSASGTTISTYTINLAGTSAEFCYLMETAHPLPATFVPGAASRGPVMVGILSGGIT